MNKSIDMTSVVEREINKANLYQTVGIRRASAKKRKEDKEAMLRTEGLNIPVRVNYSVWHCVCYQQLLQTLCYLSDLFQFTFKACCCRNSFELQYLLDITSFYRVSSDCVCEIVWRWFWKMYWNRFALNPIWAIFVIVSYWGRKLRCVSE